MELTETQYARIEPCLPRQRGNVSMPNLQVLNAILYVAEQGCKWRGAHSRFPGHALTPTGVMAIRCKQFHLPDL